MRSHRNGRKTGQIALFRLGAHAPAPAGCPIESEHGAQVEAIPHDSTQQGEQAGEAMRPAMEKRLKAQQHIEQQGRPHLPAHRVGAVAHEVAQLQGLLDLLEEDLDLPAATIEVGDGRGDHSKLLVRNSISTSLGVCKN